MRTELASDFPLGDERLNARDRAKDAEYHRYVANQMRDDADVSGYSPFQASGCYRLVSRRVDF
jgi:hypothetical protein